MNNMKKSLKIFAVVLMAMLVVFSVSTFSYADTPGQVISGINANMNGIKTEGMKSIAGRVLGLLQIVSAILAVILIAYLGFKMVLGSANEKADVQKQFIPLIIGVTIVFAATSIANLLLGIMGS
jgi:type IV secretory pathway VirB2 component (pilin)